MKSVRIKPFEITDVAQHRIGLTALDHWGNPWNYVEFDDNTTFKKGVVVKDLNRNQIISSAAATVTKAAPIGSRTLTDSGEFAGRDIRGALGHIHDGTGVGQFFIVRNVLSDDVIEIQLRNGQGWKTALDTTSKYAIVLPGRVELGQGGTTLFQVRGIYQGDDFTTPDGEFRYGWVQQAGLGQALFDNSGGDIDFAKRGVRTANSGLVQGTTSDEYFIGYAFFDDPSEATDDMLIPLEIKIRYRPPSYRFPWTDKPYNRGQL